ncbi:hypothetical protein LB533_20615 [Mesorhizobium sp. BR1-1-13]|uniref:hypothetical protein n=1 Tax=Mesorhizobium sp. BR1-1-13 TaxID=2876656 RepID=UPI001CD0D125|nr:hypothetical protein [Mesorhizobium sp. BR1-1-13]MBZ9943493.1 hypothetical protein [Mesorhizobium sp. BR1-1-13]
MNAYARHVTGAKALTLQSLARQMLDEAGGDLSAAATKLANYASNIARYKDELLLIGARKLINEVPQTQRAGILREHGGTAFAKAPHRMNDAAKATQARMRMAGRTIKSALMDLPFTIGGAVKALREWTGGEVLAHGEVELSKGTSAVRNARFLVAVGRAAGDKKIGDLGDAAVERLHKEAMSSDV